MRRKYWFIIPVVLIIFGLVIGNVATISAETIQITYADPDDMDSEEHIMALVFQSLVEARSDGYFDTELHPSEVLGTDRERTLMLQDGHIEVSFSSAGGIAPHMPIVGVLDYPFLFPNDAVARRVYDGPFLDILRAEFEERLPGVYLAGIHKRGFFHITNNQRPIETLEDLEGLAIRTMEQPSHIMFFEELGADPTPIAWPELYTSLETGVVHGQTNPNSITAFAGRLFEVQDYLTLTDHMYAVSYITVSQQWLDGLSEEHQEIVLASLEEAIDAAYGLNRQLESFQALDVLEEEGMEINSLPPEERERMAEIVQPAFREWVEDEFGEDGIYLLDKLEEHAERVQERFPGIAYE